jgi:hypothetical protein
LGKEIPIGVTVQNEGKFNRSDSITYFATRPPEEFKPYTNENIYWLSWGGEKGKRMEVKNGDLGDPIDAPFSFKVTYRGEKDLEYMNPPPPSKTEDRWFWARISAEKGYPGKRYFVIPNLTGIDAEKRCSIRFSMQGLTDDPKTDIDHHVIFGINDHIIKDATWNGQEAREFEVNFPANYLVEGDNIIKIWLSGDLDVFADQIFFDWYELDWWTGAAQNDSIKFSYKHEGEPESMSSDEETLK